MPMLEDEIRRLMADETAGLQARVRPGGAGGALLPGQEEKDLDRRGGRVRGRRGRHARRLPDRRLGGHDRGAGHGLRGAGATPDRRRPGPAVRPAGLRGPG
ncbi:hypothetical protein GCM10020219_092230 [Nonomuraea dietziae]